MLKKIIIGIPLIAALAAIAVIATIYASQPQMFHAPIFDEITPELPSNFSKPSILVFSQTNGFRHKEGISTSLERLHAIAKENNWFLYSTENGAVHNPTWLSNIDVIVWAHASGPLLTTDQRIAFREYIENGGGFVGLHAAGDDSHSEWDWYQNEVLRANFIGHTMSPHLQDAKVIATNPSHPAVNIPNGGWTQFDEWYAFDDSPATLGSTVLAVVDEATYEPGKYTMKNQHPVMWAHTVGQGRVFYSALGHTADSYEKEYSEVLKQAIKWAGQLD